MKLDKKSKSKNSEQSPLSNSKKLFSEEENIEKDSENKAKENKTLNYDKILDDFVLFNSESESKEESSENDENEELSEKSEKSATNNIQNLQLKKENSLNKKDKLNTSLQSKCTICLDQMTNPATLKPCGHQFCKDCISKWLQKSSACPDCKKNFIII